MAPRTKAGAKVLLFFDMTKFFRKKMQKTCVIGTFFVLLSSELARNMNKETTKTFLGGGRSSQSDGKTLRELHVIAYARNGHTDKFGIPRQSREESPILTRIVFEEKYNIPEALRGIEGFSHLWLLWGFSSRSHPSDTRQNSVLTEGPQALRSPQKLEIFGDPGIKDWSPTVRPPRLGGNKRMGVFATRSPFRPNPIGLSSVRLVGIADGELIVSGADVMDGTPIYDIKPYLSFSDCHPEAVNGFAEETKNRTLPVVCDGDLPPDICYILSQDPRPAYQDDPEREYKLDYDGWRVTFTVEDSTVFVKNLEKM